MDRTQSAFFGQKCLIHMKQKISHICGAQNCKNRLLCVDCYPTHNKLHLCSLISMTDLMLYDSNNDCEEGKLLSERLLQINKEKIKTIKDFYYHMRIQTEKVLLEAQNHVLKKLGLSRSHPTALQRLQEEWDSCKKVFQDKETLIQLSQSNESMAETLKDLCEAYMSIRTKKREIEESIDKYSKITIPVGCYEKFSMPKYVREFIRFLNPVVESYKLVALQNERQLLRLSEGIEESKYSSMLVRMQSFAGSFSEELRETLKGQTNLKTMQYDFNGLTQKPVLLSMISDLEKLTQLTKLSVQFDSTLCNDQTIKESCAIISKLNLNELTLNLNVPNLLFSRTRSFREKISRVVNVTPITDDSFYEIKKLLVKLKSLKAFKLYSEDARKLTDKSLKYLSEAFQEATMLERLDLFLKTNVNFTDTSAEYLAKIYTNLKKLKSFALTLWGVPKITEKGWLKFSEAFEKNTFLEKMFFDLYLPEIKENTVCSILKSTKSLFRLQKVELRFKIHHRSKYDPLLIISQSLEAASSLFQLSLDLTECGSITDEGLSSIKTILKRHKKIRFFELYCWDLPKLSKKSYKEIFLALESLDHLDHLTIHISPHPELSGEELGVLASSLKKHYRIRDLNLCFKDCSQLSEENVNEFIKEISVLRSLEKLLLSFAGLNISDTTMGLTKDLLLQNKNLYHLDLLFENCLKLTDKGFTELFESLKTLKFLAHFSTDLESCQISDSSLDVLIKLFEEKRQLECLRIHIPKTLVSENKLKTLSQFFNFVPEFSLNQPFYI